MFGFASRLRFVFTASGADRTGMMRGLAYPMGSIAGVDDCVVPVDIDSGKPETKTISYNLFSNK